VEWDFRVSFKSRVSYMQRREVQCVLERNRQNSVCSRNHLYGWQEFLVSRNYSAQHIAKALYFGFYPFAEVYWYCYTLEMFLCLPSGERVTKEPIQLRSSWELQTMVSVLFENGCLRDTSSFLFTGRQKRKHRGSDKPKYWLQFSWMW
jgi:hypothetical protein